MIYKPGDEIKSPSGWYGEVLEFDMKTREITVKRRQDNQIITFQEPKHLLPHSP